MTHRTNHNFDILVSGDLTINWYLARQAPTASTLAASTPSINQVARVSQRWDEKPATC